MRSRSAHSVLWIMLLGTASATAQPASPRTESANLERFFRQQRLLDEELHRVQFDTAPVESLVDFTWGGWIDYFYLNYDDGIQESRVFQRPSLALWGRVSIDNGAHQIFARMRLRYDYYNPGDEIERQEDWVGPEMDQLWYQIDWLKAFHASGPDTPFQILTRVGRQTVQFGTGFALDLPMDAVLLDARLYDFRVQGLFGRAVRNLPNIVQGDPVHSHSDRNFAGMQLLYEGFERHVPFAYFYFNDDRTTERPKDPFQDYSYDSSYFGLGSQGELLPMLTPDLRYWVEGVLQFGRSFGDGAWRTRDPIQAWGWDIGIEKLWRRAPMKPRLAFEYMFGSGDEDRLYYPYSGAGGNRSGTVDHQFLAFGARDTGLTLAPAISNLHIWKFGGSIQPFDRTRVDLLREFEIGNNVFLYAKNQATGAISDTTADMFQNYVGWGLDTFVNWRLTSDLAWTIRFGTFFPGSAYSVQDTRFMLLTGVTWSF